MKVYPCGIKVTTVLNNIEVIITGVIIRFNAVAYEVSYFHNGERKQVWMNEKEFTTDSKKKTIGFIK